MGVRHIRTHSRYSVEIDVTLESKARDLTVPGKLVNLGRGGAACRMEAPLRMGEPMTLRVMTDPPQVLSGEVAWVAWGESTNVRLGVRFSQEQESLVLELIEALASRSDVGT